MTQDDMVKVARDCGIGLAYGRESIERFYTFVAAAEREACAELCEEMQDRENPYERNVAVLDCASAIRARSGI
jgi:hypothetical protein